MTNKEFSLKKIKKSLLATPFLLVIPAANATDYLQCREMLRTKNEMIKKAAVAQSNYMYEYKKKTQTYDPCPYSAFESQKTMGSGKYKYTYTSMDWVAQGDCERQSDKQIEEQFYENNKPISKDYQGANIYSAEELRWAKAYGKVAADMKAADCPYE